MPVRSPRRKILRIALVAAPAAALLAAAFGAGASRAQTPAAAPQNPDEFWYARVEPALDKSCLKCHAGVRQYGGLDLRSLETTLRGGDHGPALIPGKPNESRLLQYVLPGSNPHMPPDQKKQLSPEAIAALRTWISLLPPAKSPLAVATSKDNRWVPEYLADYKRQVQAHEPPPANLSPSATIDWFLQARWRRDKVTPAAPASDSVFARRLYLDLAGRIPTTDELKRFVADPSPDKREKLVDALIASDDYPRHLREVFDTVLMGRPSPEHAKARADRGWNAFLEDAFKSNRPWNEVVRDILVARPTSGARRGSVWFLAERNNSYQAIAEAVAPVAFGVKIGCAQCHNHPLAWEIEQRHYWGMVAAFNRSKNVDTDAGPGVAESATGGFINFANLKKESQPAALVFLNGKSVAEKVPGADEKEVDAPELYLVPPAKAGEKAWGPAVPKFSRREAFADSVTRDNPLLARAFVNRMWAKYMGRGFVVPADQIDSRHRASHPELLEWLTQDFAASGYDVKRLVKNIVLTRAYQLDTKPAGKVPPRPESFARAVEKPLSAEQLMHSVQVATGSKVAATDGAELERAFVTAFPDIMPDTYNPSLQQALFLTNSPLVDRLLKPAPDSAVARLVALGSNPARVHTAFQLVLGRAPDKVEMQQCQAILAASPAEKGVRNLLWALLTCAEFQVNH